MRKLTLIQAKEGRKVRVLEISGAVALQHRLMSMGIYPGREITKLGHMALKGPVTIKVGRSVVALGHGMAERIAVEA